MTGTLTNLEKVHLYLRSIEDGKFPTELFAPEVIVEQLPNRIYPKGLRSGAESMIAAFNQGRKLLSRQKYEVMNAFENGDRIALEVLWTGTIAIPFGTLEAGTEMRAHSAMFLEFKDGKIISQRNYDCFEPW